jgi:hypothetical protein
LDCHPNCSLSQNPPQVSYTYAHMLLCSKSPSRSMCFQTSPTSSCLDSNHTILRLIFQNSGTIRTALLEVVFLFIYVSEQKWYIKFIQDKENYFITKLDYFILTFVFIKKQVLCFYSQYISGSSKNTIEVTETHI